MNVSKLTLIYLFVFSMLILSFHVQAQYFSTGQDPAKIQWRQINTVHFQLIYPEDYEEKAQQVAYVFEKVYKYGQRSLNHAPKKISVVLHTHTVKSNGLVGWSPKRVELFTTPHQRIYAQDWLEQLAIHEFRHVVQMDKIQTELPAILPIIFGEQAAAAAVAAYLPFWFIEGDAVITETALTHSGRGRLPSFLMENKAQAIEKGLFHYDKASMGSYSDFVPNRYHFGYWLTGAIRQNYGAQIWSDVLTEIGRKPFSITPFNRVLKQQTGKRKEKLYEEVFTNYLQQWKSEIDSLKTTTLIQNSPQNRFYTNYRYGTILDDSSIIALKESRDDIDRIIYLQNNQEHPIFTPGNIFQESFSANGNKLIWSERRPNLRWSHADESVIVVYDIKHKSKRSFKSQNKLFSPTISPDKTKFAVVEVDKGNRYSLAIYNLINGEKIDSFSTADNQYFFTPCWDEIGAKIFLISLSEEGKFLTSIDLRSRDFETLSSPGFYDIRNPFYTSGKIYFTSSFSGIDNIYCMNLENHITYQLTSVTYGADYPFVLDNHVIFSNYNSDGYNLSSMHLKDGLWQEMGEVKPKKFLLADKLAQNEDTLLSFSDAIKAHYNSKSYSKPGHLFNFHSWAPAYINVNDYEIRPGFSLFSQNKLGTAETKLGYEYNMTENAGKYKLGFKYSGFFPIFDSEISYGSRNSDYLLIQNTLNSFGDIIQSDTLVNNHTWKELDVDFNINVPLHFSQGKYSQIVQPIIKYSFRKVIYDDEIVQQNQENHYQSLSYQLYLHNFISKSELDIFPDWGQTLEVFYRSNPFSGMQIGELKAIHSYLYFPGFLQNHGLRFYNGYQKKNTESIVSFSDIIRYPRGTKQAQNTQMYSFAADYVFPVAYPDINLGPLAYLKRIKASVFYDFAHLKGNIYDIEGFVAGQYSGDLESCGIELTGDGHLLRIIAPVSTGIRAIYLPKSNEFVYQFLFSVSFDSI